MADGSLQQGFFERHCDKIEFGGPDECWLWTASTMGKGYGQVWARGKMLGAHREAFEAENGEGSAAGLIVRHKCDTPPCVNPAHLAIGTVADNTRDMIERGRHVAPKGEANGNSKITEADVLAIRATYVRGSMEFGAVALARRFGVDDSVIGDIVRRERWKHVP